MKKYIISFMIILLPSLFYTQVGINTNTPHEKSVLEIVSKDNNTGVLFTRLTTAQIMAISPANGDAVVDGLWVYNTDDKCYWYWAADPRNEWLKLCGISLDSPAGTATMNCALSSNTGSLTSGTAASGVSITIPYTSGNGGAYPAQNINSTGVTGLTASITAGNFVNGSGNLLFTVSGTASTSGTATFNINIGGSICAVSIPVDAAPGLADIDCNSISISGPSIVQNQDTTGVTLIVNYENGNGGSYPEQAITSSSIMGLSVYLPAGNFNNGSGELEFQLSGVPITSGIATFAIDLGGTICELQVQVEPNIGEADIDCSNSITTGTLTQGVAASGVFVTIPYSNGNGGIYSSQSYASTGVTGLTASIDEGIFNSGVGDLEFSITGTPSSSGTAMFEINMGDTICSFSINVGQANAVFSCTNITVGGTYVVKRPLSTANYLDVNLNVSSPGLVSFETDDKNGIKFAITNHNITSTGAVTVRLLPVTSTTGAYPMTSEQVSNGANGSNNQTSNYTVKNTITGTNLTCLATIDVKPLRIDGVRVGPVQRTIGNLSGGTSYGNGFISASSLSNSIATDGIIAPDLSAKASGEYRFWNTHIRNVSGSSITVDISSKSSTVEDVAYLPYSRSGLSIANNATIGSIDPFLQTSSNPTTSGDYGAFGSGDYWHELNDVGVLVLYQGMWYKYRMLIKFHRINNVYASDFQTHLVLYGIYNSKPSMYVPANPLNTTGISSAVSYDVQSYWP